jgi:TRAP-type C4-dicarboxylate transport system substrate-binding protein
MTTEPYVISTTGKSFKTVEDFSKVSLRSAARTHEFLIKNLGANSITLPSTDLYDSLSRNALDGTIQSVPDWTAYGLQEVLKYTLEGINIGHYAPVIAMDEAKYNKLPDNVKKAMDNATADSVQPGLDGWKKRSEDSRSQYEENDGKFVKLEDLDPAVQEHVKKAMEKTWFDWIAAVEKEGNPGKEIAKLWRDLILEEGGEVPDGVKNL